MRSNNNLLSGFVNVVLLILFLAIACGWSNPKIYSDHFIKKMSYESKLSKAQIYVVLNGQLTNAIQKHNTTFSVSDRDLRIATVAVICLETGNLKSKSVMVNNLFGIKKVNGRPNFMMKTNEFVNNKMMTLDQNFAVFYSITDCISGFYTFLEKDRYKKVRSATSYSAFLKEMYKAGYATDPNYYKKVKRIADEIAKTTK